MSAYPHRLRLYRSRTVHAAEAIRLDDGQTVLATACGEPEGPRDDRKPDNATVTCRTDACQLAVLPPLQTDAHRPTTEETTR
ncbi:hypothetical protein ABT093_09900 [Kitasatospora sp. NPDC002551]|uniref:hypothetical protein n=1 Tax=Kitasatospora sp. NPDC002551 TaxID=3154539 RepID=UPI00332C7F9B